MPLSLIVIGASAGGMPALSRLVGQLPASLPAAVLIVQHLAPTSSGEHLVGRLAQHTTLTCHLAETGQLIEAGHVYVAPPNRHVLVQDRRLLVTQGAHENSYRPAVDALFRSAAANHDGHVTGVVLTGLLHDGTAGLEAIQRCGGQTVVQDPLDAEFPSMPLSALHNVKVGHIVPLDAMGSLLIELVAKPAASVPIPTDVILEATIAERVMGSIEKVSQLGFQVPLTCPDCGGSLWQMNSGNLIRYRCHVGHAFTGDALLFQNENALEESLWVAMRLMEERKNMLVSMVLPEDSLASRGQRERIEELKKHINRLREVLLNGKGSAPLPSVG